MKSLIVLALLSLVALHANATSCVLEGALGAQTDANAVVVWAGAPAPGERFKDFTVQTTKFTDGTYRLSACGGTALSGTKWACQSGNFKIAKGAIIATGVIVNNDQQHPKSEKVGTCTEKTAHFSFANDSGTHVWMYVDATAAKSNDSWEFTKRKESLSFRFDTNASGSNDYVQASLKPSPM